MLWLRTAGVPPAKLGIWALEGVFLIELGEMAAILQVLSAWVLQGGCDCLNWKLEASGKFTTKATFLHIKRSPSLTFLLVSLVWKLKIPHKFKFFL